MKRKPVSLPDALRDFSSLPGIAQVRQPVVERLFGISSTTVWRRVKSGALPKPYKLGPRVTTWRVDELRRVLDAGQMERKS